MKQHKSYDIDHLPLFPDSAGYTMEPESPKTALWGWLIKVWHLLFDK